MKIDVHNHYYPERFLKQLEKDGKTASVFVEKDEWGRQILVQRGNRVVTITPPMIHIEERLSDMEKAGFDMQILTLSIPNVDIFPVEVGESLAMMVNEETAEICRRYPGRFTGFATLPFQDPERTVKELRRSVERLGMKGACIGTNINGMDLDNELLFPFYECISEYDLPVHIHPRAPRDKDSYRDYRLGPMIGFEVEICIAVVRLVMGGVLEKFPKLKFIVSHLGGAVPYLAERIQNCYEAYPECQKNISSSPKAYLRNLYYDTVSFFEPALMCAYSFAGPGQLILGSDYPHVIGDIREAVTSIESLKIPDSEKQQIFSGNILRLMRM
ncbi:MAG: amidohydrolase [Desulfobacteraceae bacterium]|nr:MAG: amidohydrolase [Desulfobacteraceae bacterium]